VGRSPPGPTMLRAAMSVVDELLEYNRRLVEEAAPVRIERRPAKELAIVTCMDARVNLWRSLGLADGDAHVLRNAGGIVTDDVIRSLSLSQRMMGTREVMLIHHTNCGLEFLDLEAAVREAVDAVQNCELLPHRSETRGFIYDVETHALREIEPT
jgi:carbonic anhydrase